MGTLNKESSRGWKKYEFPPDMITEELKEKRMSLTTHQAIQMFKNRIVAKIGESKYLEDKMAENKWKGYFVKVEGKQIRAKLNQEFIDDFIKWLQGRSTYNAPEYEKIKRDEKGQITGRETIPGCPWGNKPLHFLPGVTEFLDQGIDRREKVITYLTKLKMRQPQNIDECWIYYKYLLREAGIDSTGIKEVEDYARFDDPDKGGGGSPLPTAPLYDAEKYTKSFKLMFDVAFNNPGNFVNWVNDGADPIVFVPEFMASIQVGAGVPVADLYKGENVMFYHYWKEVNDPADYPQALTDYMNTYYTEDQINARGFRAGYGGNLDFTTLPRMDFYQLSETDRDLVLGMALASTKAMGTAYPLTPMLGGNRTGPVLQDALNPIGGPFRDASPPRERKARARSSTLKKTAESKARDRRRMFKEVKKQKKSGGIGGLLRSASKAMVGLDSGGSSSSETEFEHGGSPSTSDTEPGDPSGTESGEEMLSEPEEEEEEEKKGTPGQKAVKQVKENTGTAGGAIDQVGKIADRDAGTIQKRGWSFSGAMSSISNAWRSAAQVGEEFMQAMGGPGMAEDPAPPRRTNPFAGRPLVPLDPVVPPKKPPIQPVKPPENKEILKLQADDLRAFAQQLPGMMPRKRQAQEDKILEQIAQQEKDVKRREEYEQIQRERAALNEKKEKEGEAEAVLEPPQKVPFKFKVVDEVPEPFRFEKDLPPPEPPKETPEELVKRVSETMSTAELQEFWRFAKTQGRNEEAVAAQRILEQRKERELQNNALKDSLVASAAAEYMQVVQAQKDSMAQETVRPDRPPAPLPPDNETLQVMEALAGNMSGSTASQEFQDAINTMTKEEVTAFVETEAEGGPEVVRELADKVDITVEGTNVYSFLQSKLGEPVVEQLMSVSGNIVGAGISQEELYRQLYSVITNPDTEELPEKPQTYIDKARAQLKRSGISGLHINSPERKLLVQGLGAIATMRNHLSLGYEKAIHNGIIDETLAGLIDLESTTPHEYANFYSVSSPNFLIDLEKKQDPYSSASNIITRYYSWRQSPYNSANPIMHTESAIRDCVRIAQQEGMGPRHAHALNNLLYKYGVLDSADTVVSKGFPVDSLDPVYHNLPLTMILSGHDTVVDYNYIFAKKGIEVKVPEKKEEDKRKKYVPPAKSDSVAYAEPPPEEAAPPTPPVVIPKSPPPIPKDTPPVTAPKTTPMELAFFSLDKLVNGKGRLINREPRIGRSIPPDKYFGGLYTSQVQASDLVRVEKELGYVVYDGTLKPGLMFSNGINDKSALALLPPDSHPADKISVYQYVRSSKARDALLFHSSYHASAITKHMKTDPDAVNISNLYTQSQSKRRTGPKSYSDHIKDVYSIFTGDVNTRSLILNDLAGDGVYDIKYSKNQQPGEYAFTDPAYKVSKEEAASAFISYALIHLSPLLRDRLQVTFPETTTSSKTLTATRVKGMLSALPGVVREGELSTTIKHLESPEGDGIAVASDYDALIHGGYSKLYAYNTHASKAYTRALITDIEYRDIFTMLEHLSDDNSSEEIVDVLLKYPGLQELKSPTTMMHTHLHYSVPGGIGTNLADDPDHAVQKWSSYRNIEDLTNMISYLHARAITTHATDPGSALDMLEAADRLGNAREDILMEALKNVDSLKTKSISKLIAENQNFKTQIIAASLKHPREAPGMSVREFSQTVNAIASGMTKLAENLKPQEYSAKNEDFFTTLGMLSGELSNDVYTNTLMSLSHKEMPLRPSVVTDKGTLYSYAPWTTQNNKPLSISPAMALNQMIDVVSTMRLQMETGNADGSVDRAMAKFTGIEGFKSDYKAPPEGVDARLFKNLTTIELSGTRSALKAQRAGVKF